MKCIACKVKEIEAAARLIGERVVETLSDKIVNVFVVPEDVSLDQARQKQDNPEFREKYFSMQYPVNEKTHT